MIQKDFYISDANESVYDLMKRILAIYFNIFTKYDQRGSSLDRSKIAEKFSKVSLSIETLYGPKQNDISPLEDLSRLSEALDIKKNISDLLKLLYEYIRDDIQINFIKDEDFTWKQKHIFRKVLNETINYKVSNFIKNEKEIY